MARSSNLQRQIDRYAGIPLVSLVGALRRRRKIPAQPRRIGLISPSAIGDTILQSGLMAHIAAHLPEAEIHLFYGRGNAAILPLMPVALKTHRCSFTNPPAALKAIRAEQLDLLIDLTPWTRTTALITALSGVPCLGFAGEGQHRAAGFDVAVPHLRKNHECENLCAMAGQIAPCTDYRPHLKIPAGTALPVALADLPFERLVLCHAAAGGARAAEKAWPADYWQDLVRRMAGQGFVAGFTGVKSDARMIAEILSGLPEGAAMDLSGQCSLAQTALLMERARLLISVDTGILHLGSALGVSMIGLFGPTKAANWGGLSPRGINIESEHPARGYVRYGFENGEDGGAVMRGLSVDRVWNAVLRQLGNAEDSEKISKTGSCEK